MPLLHSKSAKARDKNIGTLTKEIGKSPHIQSKAQAIAIAYETQRRAISSKHGKKK
jgi:hypothetical protein